MGKAFRDLPDNFGTIGKEFGKELAVFAPPTVAHDAARFGLGLIEQSQPDDEVSDEVCD